MDGTGNPSSLNVPNDFLEVIRFLMRQIQEEQRLREECLQGVENRSPLPEISDREVEAKIIEIKEVLGNVPKIILDK